MSGEVRDVDLVEMKRQIEEAMESGAMDEAMREGMDFEGARTPLEVLISMMNIGEHHAKDFPELTRDFTTSNLDWRTMYAIYELLQTAYFKKRIGLGYQSEINRILALLTLNKSRNGWLGELWKKSSVEVRGSPERKRSWWRR